ncbi:hypothetical protein [Planktothrix pseudagardhii]|uniref:Leucine-rich repeat-containing protein DDB_G0290503 n=1 Tax=Planktothrix pseudagardhii TaxID=132604 RepID=A0A9W4D2I8_9CYAN|nr:hypothetical protein [Planktothrix pseudagardhii]CAD5936857.1 Putative leucine-rich repeat-containing protein DDB_G0290503 [Planktothrix pseudagardhii]
MDTQNYQIIKMTFFTQKNLLSQAKIVWKTLVILLLSALLFVPKPALALDYNGTIQSYISNAKVELDGVLTAIEKLPNLSYETGKATLSEIESQLQKIQTEAGKNSADFQKLSDEGQKESNKLLNEINKLYVSQQALEKEVQRNEVEYQQKQSELERIQRAAKKLGAQVDNQFIQGADNFRKYLEKNKSDLLLIRSRLNALKDSRAKLENDNQKLSDGIVLANKICTLSDHLEKRINLVTQKAGNVKKYGDALESFSDPDILSEISEFNEMVANLTTNL